MGKGINIHARRSGFRTLRKLILIVCEGARTEPSYFECFPLPKQVREIHGAGANTLSVVQEAIRLRGQGSFDEVWCVFDRDSFPEKRITKAFELAKAEKIKIAFSNEAFELWYLLHFQYLDTAISRADYCVKLSKVLGKKYLKNDLEIYEQLLPRQAEAMKHAKKLNKNANQDMLHKICPVTTVHKLVERLNKLCTKKRSW